MSTEQNKASFCAIVEEVLNAGNPAAIDHLFAPDYIEHTVLPAGFLPDLAGLKAFFTMLRRAFSDLQWYVELALAEGDLVTGLMTASGTHTGEFLGIAPTGKRITWMETHIALFADGRVVEHWGQIDQLSILQQLGVVPQKS